MIFFFASGVSLRDFAFALAEPNRRGKGASQKRRGRCQLGYAGGNA